MDPVLIILGVLVLVLLGLILSMATSQPYSRRHVGRGPVHTEAGDAEIEAVDIDQMLDALNERRRRAGRPPIGDELARQLEPHLRDG